MQTFFSNIYESWRRTQQEKFVMMREMIEPLLLDQMLSGNVLDIGCGAGYFQRVFAGNFIGIDIDPVSMRSNDFPCVLADGNALPFKDKTFDSVVSTDTMHLISTKDFARVLKPKGFAMLSVFFNDDNYDQRRENILKKLKGFKLIEEFDVNAREKEYVAIAQKTSR